jgi:hypothetical protein
VILKLTTNIPARVALKYDEGVPKESTFTRADGTPVMQVQYTLTNNDVLYVPEHVAEKIRELGIRRLTPFEICKAQEAGDKNITWRVRRIEETQQPVTTPAAAPVATTTVPVSHQQNGAAAASPRGAQQNGHSNGSTDPFAKFDSRPHTGALPPAPLVTSAIVNGDGTVTRGYANGHAAPIIHTKASQQMAGALIASIDAWRTAVEYATSKGFALTPTSEDVRTVANTLVINAQRAGGAQ